MAGHVMQTMKRALCALSTGVGTSVWAMGPAAPFVAPMSAREAIGQADASGTAGFEAAAVSGLTGVRLGRNAGAVIDGQWVRKGHSVRGAKLVQIERTRVTLKHPDGHQEIIEMYPPASGQAGAAVPASTEAAKP